MFQKSKKKVLSESISSENFMSFTVWWQIQSDSTLVLTNMMSSSTIEVNACLTFWAIFLLNIFFVVTS